MKILFSKFIDQTEKIIITIIDLNFKFKVLVYNNYLIYSKNCQRHLIDIKTWYLNNRRKMFRFFRKKKSRIRY